MDKMQLLAMKLARQAGKELLKQFNNFDRSTIRLKSKHEIVTKSDIIAEKIIIKAIRKQFPTHTILSEEAGLLKAEDKYMWIIDPLDGTTNFSMHNPLFATSIGLAYQGEIILGAIYSPVLDELYVGIKNKKAFLLKGKTKKRMKVSKVKDEKVFNTFCHGSRQQDMKRALAYYRHQKINQLDCRQLGSASIEMAYVAMGRSESIAIPGANSWDVAAGVVMVREAGGRVTDFKGNEWNLKSKDILASNGLVHNDILKVVNKL